MKSNKIFLMLFIYVVAPIYYKLKFGHSTIDSYIGLRQNIEEPIKIGKNVEISGNVKIGRNTSIMENCHIGTNTVSIGRYCSIARGCVIAPNNHPLNLLSTSASFYSKSWAMSNRDLKSKFNENKNTVILNDVWIGANVIILPGVRIGNGAVIGAGSVVTKDVDDYAIVAGNPARVVKFRFEEKIISSLLEFEWWELPHEELINIWDLEIHNSISKLSTLKNK